MRRRTLWLALYAGRGAGNGPLDFTVMDSSGPHIDTPGLDVEQSGANTLVVGAP